MDYISYAYVWLDYSLYIYIYVYIYIYKIWPKKRDNSIVFHSLHYFFLRLLSIRLSQSHCWNLYILFIVGSKDVPPVPTCRQTFLGAEWPKASLRALTQRFPVLTIVDPGSKLMDCLYLVQLASLSAPKPKMTQEKLGKKYGVLAGIAYSPVPSLRCQFTIHLALRST